MVHGIKAVIFDMDGTLVLSNALHFSAYQKVFDRYGITADYTDFTENLIGIGAYNVIKTILQKNGVESDYKKLADIKRDIFSEMLHDTTPKVVGGLYEFLDFLEKRGIAKGVASAASKQSILEVLESIKVRDRFPVVVSCEEVPKAKPFPDVFLEAGRQLGITSEGCMIVEDTAHGVMAGVAAGMTAVGLRTTQAESRLREAGAKYICTDFTEVMKLW